MCVCVCLYVCVCMSEGVHLTFDCKMLVDFSCHSTCGATKYKLGDIDGERGSDQVNLAHGTTV